MRWKAREPLREGAFRDWHRVFAWLPVEIDGHWCWLETIERSGRAILIMDPTTAREWVQWSWHYRRVQVQGDL